MAEKFASIDDYISSFPEDVQIALEEVRRTIRKVVLTAGETISYQIPAVTLDGRYLVYFAAWKHHVSLYPIPAGDEAFEREIAPYKAGKGTLRFPLREPIPHDLIERVVALLVKERAGSQG
ncbi:MAG: iron chaperone [Carbonactinosporaceae bacterium]